jgi:DNA-binding NarL/FixJ family response regulator
MPDLTSAIRVFVVEDEALIAMELADRLIALGHVVCGHASRGEQALARVPVARPDVILMDINLGRGPNGIDVAELLRPIWAAPVVFLSAYTDAEISERVTRHGASAYLVKPFRPEALDTAIRAVVSARPGDGASG